MGVLIKESFLLYLFLTIFSGLWFLCVGFGVIKKTRKMENPTTRIALCSVVCSAFGFLWLFFLAYQSLYPISLAYYEYKNDKTEEVIGTVECIEQTEKDIICLTIDGTEYKIVHNSAKPYVRIGIDFSEGDIVHIVYGECSQYIFDINELKQRQGTVLCPG